ncbi:MAG: serpin family protein [Brevinematales bacterium]|nr:serpin family protein [Brevinematales bacterium]
MKKIFAGVFAAVMAMGLMTGCQDGATVSPEWKSVKLDAKVLKGQQEFGWNLLKKLYSAKPDGNIILSPVSVSFALSCALDGASGETLAQMKAVMGMQDASAAGIHTNIGFLMYSLLNRDPEVLLSIANSLWVMKGDSLMEDYRKSVKTFYNAETAVIDPSDAGMVGRINDWVKGATKGMIDSIIGQIPDGLSVLILNAVYFKGVWAQPFPVGMTADLPFTCFDKTKKTTKMMYMQAKLPYYEEKGFQSVSMDYGKGKFAMAVVLPAQGTDMAAFINSFGADKWNTVIAGMGIVKVEMGMHRFTAESDLGLNDTMMALGMPAAFGGGFDKMVAGENLFISVIKQKAKIIVNEQGSEASAVTAIQITKSSVEAPEKMYRMICDRPFLYAIVDRETGIPLFMGVMGNP